MPEAALAADAAESPWVRRWSHLVPPNGTVLDVACGSGRHVRWFAARGCRVTGVDRDAAAMQSLRPLADIVVADLEGAAWPFAGRAFDAVVVTRYLWRPLFADLLASVAPGGLLLCETFATGQETVGRPANPVFLLAPGELLHRVDTLRIVAFEDGFEPASDGSPGRFTQRIVATRGTGTGTAPPRYPLG